MKYLCYTNTSSIELRNIQIVNTNMNNDTI